MYRASRRTTLFARFLILALLVPIIVACGGGTEPTASPAASPADTASPAPAESPDAESPEPAESPDAESPEPAESPDAESPEPAESPEAEGSPAAPGEAAEVPINDKTLIIGYNQFPETLFGFETSSSIQTQVVVGLGNCVNGLDYEYQPTHCFEEFPTFENGGAVTETVEIDPATISEDSPIVVDGVLITDTAAAEEAGIEIPSELPQLTTTYDLNPDLRWQDGEPVTAEDAIFVFEQAKSGEYDLVTTYVLDRLQSVEQGENENQVVQTWVPGYLESDYYIYLGAGYYFMPAHEYEGLSADEIRQRESEAPFSFGPYMVEENLPQESTTLVNNPYFFDQPNIGTVIFTYLADADQVLAQLESGTIDVAGSIGLTLNQLPQLQELEEAGTITVQTVAGTVWEHLDFGIQRADGQPSFFEDVRVRQAVAYAINRQQIIDEVLFGETQTMNTYVPAEHPSYPGDDALEAYDFDPDRARELLEEAGATDSDGDGIRELDGRPMQIQFYTTEGQRQRELAAQVIQNNLRDVGIDMQLNFVPGTEVLFKVGEDGILYGRRFDIALYAWVSGVDASHNLYLGDECPGPENGYTGQNSPCYQNPEFDAAARAALAEVDLERKRELDAEPLIIFNRDLPAFPLFQRVNLAAFKPTVTGVQLNPTSDFDFYNIQDIDIEQE